MDLHRIAAAVIARARDNSPLTTPEFDHMIAARGIGGPNSELGQAAYEIANQGHGGTADEREARWTDLWQQLQPEMQAYGDKCRNRKYSGWSDAARAAGQRIRYAD